MKLKNLLVSLLPWIAFGAFEHFTGPTTVGVPALLAAVIAVVLMFKNRGSGIKIIDVTGVVTFGVLAVIAFAGGLGASEWISNFGRGGAAAVVGIVMLASAAFVPFSEQYARESVPQQYWNSPVFRATNRKISALWGAIMIVMAGGHFLAGQLDPVGTPGSPVANLVLNFVVPVGLIFLGYKATTGIAAAAHHNRNNSTTDTVQAAG